MTDSNTTDFLPHKDNIHEAITTLSALANSQRLQILCLLNMETEMNVGDLHSKLSLSQSALSQHLAKLRDQGFIESRKEGLNVYYKIGREDVIKILKLLHELYCA